MLAPPNPPHKMGPFRGAPSTLGTMVSQVKGPRGERSVFLRSMTEGVVRGLQDKDYLSEILAIRNFVAERIRYTNDPLTTEWVKDPQRMAEEIRQDGRSIADCDEIASLIATMCRQVGREAEFVTVGFDRPNVFTHVFARVKEPKSGTWIVCDPVAGTNEARMLRRVKTSKFWRID